MTPTKAAGAKPGCPAAQLRRPQADGNHRQQVVQARKRVGETFGQPGARRAERMRLGRRH